MAKQHPFNTTALKSVAAALFSIATNEKVDYLTLLQALVELEKVQRLDVVQIHQRQSTPQSLRALHALSRDERLMQLRTCVSQYNMLAIENDMCALVITTGVTTKSSSARIMARLRAVHELHDKLLAKIEGSKLVTTFVAEPEPEVVPPEPIAPNATEDAPVSAVVSIELEPESNRVTKSERRDAKRLSLEDICAATGRLPKTTATTVEAATTAPSKNAEKKRAKKAAKKAAALAELQAFAAEIANSMAAKPTDPFAHLSDEDAKTAREFIADGCTVEEVLNLFDEIRPIAAE